MSVGDKAFRVVRFLLGVRHARVAEALAEYGFRQRDVRLAAVPSRPRDTATLVELDAWENRWFPVAQAALERRFPALAARFFLNLTQTEGPGVAILVCTFVDRFDELAAGSERFGGDAPRAVELLRERGVTAAVEEARALLVALTQLTRAPELSDEDEQERNLARAEVAMWAWYLEWSRIARVAIKQRGLLRQLGFRATPRGNEEDGEIGITCP